VALKMTDMLWQYAIRNGKTGVYPKANFDLGVLGKSDLRFVFKKITCACERHKTNNYGKAMD